MGPGANFSVECDGCQMWYHGLCVELTELNDVPDTWRCPPCIQSNIQPRSTVSSDGGVSSSGSSGPGVTLVGEDGAGKRQLILYFTS